MGSPTPPCTTPPRFPIHLGLVKGLTKGEPTGGSMGWVVAEPMMNRLIPSCQATIFWIFCRANAPGIREIVADLAVLLEIVWELSSSGLGLGSVELDLEWFLA